MAFSLKRPSARLTRSGNLQALQWGAIAGGLLCITTIFTQILAYKTYASHLWIHDLLLFLLMAAGARKYRKKQNDFLSLRQAYLFCVFVGFIATALFVAFFWYYAEYVNINLISDYVAHQENILLNAEISEIELHQQLNNLKQANASWLAAITATELLLLSVFVPLLLAVFLRKEKSDKSPSSRA